MTTENKADSTLIDLKTARENLGLTLKELFERTRISVVNLEAIENSNFHILPVPIYTRNFIKTYADALGVDAKPVLQRYENYLQALQRKEQERVIEPPPNTPLASILNRHKAYLWIGCTILVFGTISFFVSIHNKPLPEKPPQKTEALTKALITTNQTPNIAQPDNLSIALNLSKPEDSVTVKQTASEQKQPEQKAAVTPPPNTTKPAAAPKNNKTKTEAVTGDEERSALVVHATEETWLRIQADNKEPFQVLLKPGENTSQKAARFNLDIGNAGGVRIQLNGKVIENLGKSGEVVHLRLP